MHSCTESFGLSNSLQLLEEMGAVKILKASLYLQNIKMCVVGCFDIVCLFNCHDFQKDRLLYVQYFFCLYHSEDRILKLVFELPTLYI